MPGLRLALCPTSNQTPTDRRSTTSDSSRRPVTALSAPYTAHFIALHSSIILRFDRPPTRYALDSQNCHPKLRAGASPYLLSPTPKICPPKPGGAGLISPPRWLASPLIWFNQWFQSSSKIPHLPSRLLLGPLRS